MKFRISPPQSKARHSQCVAAIGWAAGDHLYTIGDDSKILRWNANNTPHTFTEVATLPDGVYATDMQWFGGIGSSRKHGGAALDTFAMATSDGRFYFISAAGRVEKVVEAHKGATVCLRWSPEGTTLATGGEDGAVKIWSRAGMQRTVLAQKPNTVYGLAWSADAENLIFCSKNMLCIKQLTPGAGGGGGGKPNEWVAHDGLILSVDWSAANGCICSGSEDRTYRIWDALGRLLFTSMQEEQPVTSLAWSPDGTMLGVGSFNTLRLCDAGGVSQHVEKLPIAGSLYRLAWSSNNTKLAAGTAVGFVVFAQIVLRSLTWNAVRATLSDVDKISVTDVHGELNQNVELPQPIVYFSLGFDHLIAVTTGKLHIFSSQHLTTPAVIDLKDAGSTTAQAGGGSGVLFIVQAQTHFVVISTSGIYLYGYQGRLICQPRNQSVPSENLSPKTLALNQSFLAFVDRAEPSKIYIYDAVNGREACEPVVHSEHITHLGIDQSSTSTVAGAAATTGVQSSSYSNFLSFIDVAMDLYVAPIIRATASPSTTTGTANAAASSLSRPSPRKVGSPVSSAQWHSQHAILAFIEEQTTLKILSHPMAAFILKGELQPLATFTLQQKSTATATGGAGVAISTVAVDLGRRPQIECFIGSRITIRRSDGAATAAATTHVGVPVHLIVLHEQLGKGNWSGALKICRLATSSTGGGGSGNGGDDHSLWAACAAFAIQQRQLEPAEAAFAALRDFPKIEALQKISRRAQNTPNAAVLKKAELSIFAADFYDAESLLLQNGMIFEAIMMHIDVFNWQRALQVAQRYKKFVDVVVGCRQKYLKTIGKQEEVLPQFAALNSTLKIDWPSVEKSLTEYQQAEGGFG